MRVRLALSVIAMGVALSGTHAAAIDVNLGTSVGLGLDSGGLNITVENGTVGNVAVDVAPTTADPTTLSAPQLSGDTMPSPGGESEPSTASPSDGTTGNDTSDRETLAVADELFGSSASFQDGEDFTSKPAGKRAAKCLSPNRAQLAHLLSRNQYAPEMGVGWARARVKLVPVNICAEARAAVSSALSADSNIAVLRSIIADTRKVRRSLSRERHDDDDVLAIDQKNGSVIVYVF